MAFSFHTIKRFVSNRDGNVAPIFAAVLIPMIGLAGGAYDYSRASNAEENLQSSLDAAGLSAAREGGTYQSMQQNILGMMETNYPVQAGNPVDMKVQISGQEMKLVATQVIPTTLLGIVGKNDFTIKAETIVFKDAGFASGTVKAQPHFQKPTSNQLARYKARMERHAKRLPHSDRIVFERQLKAQLEALEAMPANGSSNVRLSK